MGAGPRVCANPSGESVTVPNAAPAAVPVRIKSRLVRRMLILPNRSRGLGQYIQMLLPIYFGSAYLRAMQVITILNRCHRFSRFVYQHAQFSSDNKSIESQCGRAPPRSVRAVIGRRPDTINSPSGRFESIPFWGFLGFLLYTMRRVDCRHCAAVVVEEVPWADGKRTLTKAYMLFLARWACRLSWKETAQAFRTSWDKVFDAVEHVVTWGLEHRVLGQIDAIGVDEIQYAKGHKYLTLVYQIDVGITRLLWVRTHLINRRVSIPFFSFSMP